MRDTIQVAQVLNTTNHYPHWIKQTFWPKCALGRCNCKETWLQLSSTKSWLPTQGAHHPEEIPHHVCLFSFDDFTMFLPSLLYWIKLKLSFHLSASVCVPFLDSILHFNLPFSITRLQNSERQWLSLTHWTRVGQNLTTRTNRVGYGHLHLPKLYCLHQS
jgi:hypothetical protein